MQLICPTCRSGLEVPDGTTAHVRCPACKSVFPAEDGLAPAEPVAFALQVVSALVLVATLCLFAAVLAGYIQASRQGNGVLKPVLYLFAQTASGLLPGSDLTDQSASLQPSPQGVPTPLAMSTATNLLVGGDGIPARFVLPDRAEPIPYLIDADFLPAGMTLTQAGKADEAGNVISCNRGDGIHILGDSTDNLIFGNLIGLGRDGDTALGNDEDGVLLEGTGDNHVGELRKQAVVCRRPVSFYDIDSFILDEKLSQTAGARRCVIKNGYANHARRGQKI